MSISLLEVITSAGYDLTTKEDSLWLLGKVAEFGELVDKSSKLLDDIEEKEWQESMAESQKELEESEREQRVVRKD